MLTEDEVAAVVANAIAFLKSAREPHALLFMGLIHRRFGVKEFANALELAAALMSALPRVVRRGRLAVAC